jgi:hypothetical protein
LSRVRKEHGKHWIGKPLAMLTEGNAGLGILLVAGAKKFLVLSEFLGVRLFLHSNYINQLYLVGIGQWRIDTLAGNKLADASHQPRAIFPEKEINKHLASIGIRGLSADRRCRSVAHKLAEAHVILGEPLLAVNDR